MDIIKFGIVVKEINAKDLKSGDLFAYKSSDKPYLTDLYNAPKHPAEARTGNLFYSSVGATKESTQIFYSEKSLHGNSRGKFFTVHLIHRPKNADIIKVKATDYPEQLRTFVTGALTFLQGERAKANEYYKANKA